MSKTFKDVPFWVREKRALTVTEHHVGCPYADRPRRHLVEVTTTSAPAWRLAKYPHTHFQTYVAIPDRPGRWVTTSRLEHRYDTITTTEQVWEPYWVDVCDLDVRGHGKLWNNSCNYELASNDPLWHERNGGPGMRPQYGAERHNSHRALTAARKEWNANGFTDIEPAAQRGIAWL